MKSVVLAASLVAASGGVASAGGYLGIGIGTAPTAHSNDTMLGNDGRSGRLLLGQRFGNLGIEGSFTGYTLADMGGNTYDTRQLGIAGKLNLPLQDHFEAYGRIGMHRTWVSGNQDGTDSASGDGYLIGGGIEYRINLGVGGGSLWMDYSYNQASLVSDSVAATRSELSSRMWMLGVSIGI